MGQVARQATLSLRLTLRLWISWINPCPLLPALLVACFLQLHRSVNEAVTTSRRDVNGFDLVGAKAKPRHL